MQSNTEDALIRPTILLVDDVPANLHLLAGMLKDRGYKTRVALSGPLALEAVQKMPPDLILLDINMPEMDGYETCRRLKANSAAKNIPVIFISALNETMDKVKAFGMGGVDYVTKPFQFEEVEARIRTHLELRRQKRELQANYEKLRELESLRDSIIHMVVHDMRSPLTVISVYMDLLQTTASAKLDDEESEWVESSLRTTQALLEMVSQLLDITRMESGQMPLTKKACSLVDVAVAAIEPLRILAGKRTLGLDAPEDILATCDENVVRRIIGNLVGNAIKFTQEHGEVRISITRTKCDTVRVSVADNGFGIPHESLESIFEKFSQVDGEHKNKGFGIGLAFCRLAIESHGGRIGVESEPDKGSTFWFDLPLM